MSQALILLLETLAVLLVVGFVHNKRRTLGLGLVYATLLLLILSTQWTADLNSMVMVGNFRLFFSSTVLFSGILMGIFLICVFDGLLALRRLMFVLVLGQVYYFLVMSFLRLLGQSPVFIAENISWYSNHFFSLVATILDLAFVGVVWGFFSRHNPKQILMVKIFITLLGVCLLDTLIFVGGAFFGHPMQASIMNSSLFIRSILAIVVTPVVSAYLWHEFRTYGESIEARSGWEFFGPRSELELRLKQDRDRIMTLEELREELDKKSGELQKYKQAVDFASDHIIITDSDGVVIYANQSVERITGFSPEEVIGKKAGVKELWGGQMPKEFYAKLWKTIKVDKKPFVGEVVNKRKNGEKYTALSNISPVLDQNNKVLYFVGIERDITKEKEVDRMKTEFISLAAHQLRTPITALKWLTETLLSGDAGELNKNQAELVKNISNSSNSMLALVKSLLNVTRIESGRLTIEPTVTNLKKLVDSAIKELESVARNKDIKLMVVDATDLPDIKVDEKLVCEIYKNLLSNAIKYSPKGTEVRVEIVEKGPELISSISDSGYGIPAKSQDRVFQKFFRAENVFQKEEGTGLGLYLVKQIVEASGGRIWFESEENKGTTFFFSLPLLGSPEHKGEVRLS